MIRVLRFVAAGITLILVVVSASCAAGENAVATSRSSDGVVTTNAQAVARTAPEAWAVVADDLVTLGEFESLVLATVDCMHMRGLEVKSVQINSVGNYGWTIADDDRQDQVVAGCRAQYLDFVVAWLALNG